MNKFWDVIILFLIKVPTNNFVFNATIIYNNTVVVVVVVVVVAAAATIVVVVVVVVLWGKGIEAARSRGRNGDDFNKKTE